MVKSLRGHRARLEAEGKDPPVEIIPPTFLLVPGSPTTPQQPQLRIQKEPYQTLMCNSAMLSSCLCYSAREHLRTFTFSSSGHGVDG